MTNQELNRDIKRLQKKVLKLQNDSGDDLTKYFDIIEKEVKPEFMRLFRADSEFKVINRAGILILLRLNILYRIAPFHTFGLNIDLEKI